MADELKPLSEEEKENQAAAAEWKKYVRPKSLTWWVSVFPIFLGLLLAVAQAFAWTPVIALIAGFAPGMGPGTLVNLGLFGIGLRGAIK